MERTTHGWTIIDEDAGVLTRGYSFSESGKANSFAARLSSGKMLVVSPPKGLSDGEFDDVCDFGEVAAVVANNGFHHLGQPEWRKRFPDARFFAAPQAQDRIKKKAPDVGAFEPLSDLGELLGDDIGLTVSPGTKVGESWVWAKVKDGYAWYTSDVFCNWDKFPGNFLLGALWKLTKSGPGFRLFHLAMMATTKDKKALLKKLLDDLEAHPPSVLIPGHGPMLSQDGIADEARSLVRDALG